MANDLIKKGKIIVFPTDTLYGIGCDPYNSIAVKKIFDIKKRIKNKPLPILTNSIENAKQIIEINERGIKLISKFWPGALTIIGNLIDEKISSVVTGDTKKLGVRIPNCSCTLKLLNRCKFLIGTSANISNMKPYVNANELLESSLSDYDAIIVDNNNDPKNTKGSTIVDITNYKLKIVREGDIEAKQIYDTII
ncbi:MAG: L-threonylcarbamoyladenylate synthase [Nitrososphaeraceae archaeon]